jgi:hypothetical protein
VRRNYFASQTVEANAGRLRLARRKDRMYYLFAENDSDQFRIIGESSYPTSDLQLEGVRLVMQTYGQTGSTSVVWKNLTVRAEGLSGPAMEDIAELLKQLDRQRNELPESFTHDFTRQPPAKGLFDRGTDDRTWKPGDLGLRIVAPGTDNWTSVGASLLKKIEGDFDISIRGAVTRFDRPAESKNSGVYLQVELANDDRTRASILLFKTADARTEVLAQLRVPNGRGGYDYPRVGGRLARSVGGLRLARRGKRVFFLATSEDFGGEQVVAYVDVDDAPIRIGGTQVLVHTGGAGRESHLLWKDIKVKAARISSERTE